ncbi:MAG TPA: response regulator, partial [Polyangiaceae bacterium]|nr:response regulator [Polyangiaceae bacterium]
MSKILIIDDDVDFGDLTRRRLTRMGFDVKLHPGAFGVMDLLLRDSFDLVILDVKMPGLNGTDVIKMIRTLRTGLVSVMFYSSSDSTELRQLAEAHGAQGYLTKTATMGELEFRIRALLGGARSSRSDVTR